MIIFNALQTSLSGGIGRYSYELSKAVYLLNKLPIKIIIRQEDKFLFSFANNKDLIILDGVRSGKDRNYQEQFVLPKMIYKNYKDAVIHYPDSMSPIFAKNKVIITIHDLAFITRKEDLTKKTALWKNFITSKSVKKASNIICITNFAKKEVEKYYPSVSSKLDVVYNGFNDFSKEEILINKIRRDVIECSEQSYILTVSTISPRKNMDGLIKAFYKIMDKIPHNLIIAGGNGWLYENIYKLVDELNIKHRVVFTGKVNDEELKYLYKNASVFVYPSFYEGFGLPPLEAMSYGIPCVSSNVTSIPEVLKDATLYIDPHSVDDISEKVFNIISSKNHNKMLIENGYKRISEFSWDRCAKETIGVYNKVLK